MYRILHAIALGFFAVAMVHADPPTRIVVDVGQREGAIRGEDHRAIQAAIDYAANLGGGTVCASAMADTPFGPA